jgi:hypothetical protein
MFVHCGGGACCLAAEQAAADKAARSCLGEHTAELASPRSSFIHITVAGSRVQQVLMSQRVMLLVSCSEAP